MKLRIFTLWIIAVLAACALIQSNNSTVQLLVQQSVIKSINGDKDRADKILLQIGQIRQLLDKDEEISLANLSDALIAKINLGSVDHELAKIIILQIQINLEKQINDGVLNPDDKISILNVLDWIESAALSAVPR